MDRNTEHLDFILFIFHFLLNKKNFVNFLTVTKKNSLTKKQILILINILKGKSTKRKAHRAEKSPT